MAESLRDQLKASMEKLEQERIEVLEKDKEVFGSSPELEEIQGEQEEHKEVVKPEPEHKEDPIEDDNEVEEREVEPLSHWPEEKRKTFQNLSKEAKEFVLERERDFNSDYTKKTQKLAEERKIAEKYRQSISPHEEYLKNLGLDPYEAAQNLIAFERKLNNASPKEKAKMLQQLADQYHADFSESDEPETPSDPKISRLEREIQDQKNLLSQIQREREQSKQYEIESHINNFRNAKTSSGQLKYPHFDKVSRQMGVALEIAQRSGEPITMEDAYESALTLNKELRGEVISNYHKDKFREEDKKKRLSESKNAAFMVKGSGSLGKQAPRELSIREALERAMSEANAY